MRTATHLQLFRFKCVAFVQQEYHNSISSSRGFCRFFERKCKKIKISRSEIVSQAQQVHPRYREFVTPVLRFTVFRIVLSHLTCCILFFYTFSAIFFMHFYVCLLAYMHISKCNRLLCALFRSTPCNSSVSNVLLLCNKSITIASHRQGVSVDFLRENAKKSKFPVLKSFHKRNKFIQDTVNLLRPCCASPFLGLFCHT